MPDERMGEPSPLEKPYRPPLHLVWMVDCSGSMSGEKIKSLNASVRECIPPLRKVHEDNPYAELLVRVIKFSCGASWHLQAPTPVQSFEWEDLQTDSLTDLGAAIDLLTEAFEPKKMGKGNVKPVLVLVSDGMPTDNWKKALTKFNATGFGKHGRTIRVAIYIYPEGKFDAQAKNVLAEFTGNPETVFEAKSATQLAKLVSWATVTLTAYASKASHTPSDVAGATPADDPEPDLPPAPVADEDDDDVFKDE